MRISLTDKNIEFIKSNRLVMSGTDMAKTIGASKSVVQRFMKCNGLSVSKELKQEFRTEKLKGRTTATQYEDQFIKDNYLILPLKTMGSKLNRGGTFINSRLRALGLSIPKELTEQRKLESQYSKGSIPLNKGKVMPDEVRIKCAKSWFKKGNIPPNTKDRNGIIVTRWDHAERGNKAYKFIRISMGKWELYHKFLWEQTNGKIPRSHCLWFKDGDSMNCTLDNLELITRAENMKRNTVHNLPKDLALTVQLRGALNRKINSKLKLLKNEK